MWFLRKQRSLKNKIPLPSCVLQAPSQGPSAVFFAHVPTSTKHTAPLSQLELSKLKLI